jgi:hypothetical protein
MECGLNYLYWNTSPVLNKCKKTVVIYLMNTNLVNTGMEMKNKTSRKQCA